MPGELQIIFFEANSDMWIIDNLRDMSKKGREHLGTLFLVSTIGLTRNGIMMKYSPTKSLTERSIKLVL